jgi:hypothetical protein
LHYLREEEAMTPVIYMWIVLTQISADAPRPIDGLLRAIRSVESRGNDEAVGDGGRAIGPYQIHYAYWKDSGVPGRWEQCRNRKYAEQVVQAYWRKYCRKALAAGDWQTLGMVHNGGPKGDANPATRGYWRKLRSAIEVQDRTSLRRSALKLSNATNRESP